MIEQQVLASALPRYEIGPELGRGAFGIVVAGRHKSLGREVAIKQLPRAFSSDAEVRARFVSEAQLLASLEHPHIVPIYDYVEREGLCLLVMELLPGGTIWERFQQAGFTLPASCAIVAAASAALHYAHGRGVLHRDVKPENLLFSGAQVVKLTDFGIAKVLGGAETLATTRGEVLGTPAYIAPEQAKGEDLSAATDVYALGVMLYELVSGRLPFSDDGGAFQVLYRHVHERPRPLRDVAPEAPEAVAAVAMQALATEPEDRFASAEEFGVALVEAATMSLGPHWLDEAGVPLLGAERLHALVETAKVRSSDPSRGALPTQAAATDAVFAHPAQAGHRQGAIVGQTGQVEVVSVSTLMDRPTRPSSMPRIGAYAVERRLGSGSFATVWLARDERLDAMVAVKVLADNWATDEHVKQRFLDEARILWQLNDDRIIRVHSVGELDDGRPYFVMDYADAGSLEERMRRRGEQGSPFSVEEAVTIGAEIADCLTVAHSEGVIHRDLKPSNVLFRTIPAAKRRRAGPAGPVEGIVLGDFGIARRLKAVSAFTITGGTPSYMAPEQADSESAARVDERADVYSAAVILYELLVGHLPFGRDTVAQVRAAQGDEVRAAIGALPAEAPVALARALEKALAPAPDQRYASADLWAHALRASIGMAEPTLSATGPLIAAVPATGPINVGSPIAQPAAEPRLRTPGRHRGRRLAVASAAAGVLLVGATLIAVSASRGKTSTGTQVLGISRAGVTTTVLPTVTTRTEPLNGSIPSAFPTRGSPAPFPIVPATPTRIPPGGSVPAPTSPVPSTTAPPPTASTTSPAPATTVATTPGTASPPVSQPGGNLLQNPSFETWAADGTPSCWMFSYYGDSDATISRSTSAHLGQFAATVSLTRYGTGARTLATTQDSGACAPAAAVGHAYQITGWYKSTVPVVFGAWYRAGDGSWPYWIDGPTLGAAATYTQFQWSTPPVPSGATNLSVGFILQAVGSFTADDVSLVAS